MHAPKTNKNVFKTLIAAEYSGVEVKVVEDFQMGVSNKTPEFLKMNPIGKVIVLIFFVMIAIISVKAVCLLVNSICTCAYRFLCWRPLKDHSLRAMPLRDMVRLQFIYLSLCVDSFSIICCFVAFVAYEFCLPSYPFEG